MYLKYIFILLSLILLLTNTTAQKAYFGFDTGYGTYEMSENKEVIKGYISSNELQPHCVSNFPGYIFFRPYLEIEYQHLNIGVAYTLLSTGSRYSIHDYTGDYKFDSQIIGNTFAMFAETPLYSFNKFKLLIAAESGCVFNKMKLTESFQFLDTYNQQEDYKLESINFFIKPYLKGEYEIGAKINANIVFGYHIDLKANHMQLNDDDRSESEFVANWIGIRTSIGITYRLD
jgi:hypothetical protein